MKVEEHHISFQKSGRFFTQGNPETAKELIIAFHGYGYLASFFIKKFEQLDPKKYFIICPEGIHRFYLNDTKGRVGASWMTKEDRLKDIEDNIRFLNTILKSINEQYQFEKKIILGFSQGGATASRFIAYGDYTFDEFILWAAVFPPDMDPEYNKKFQSSKNYFVVGDEDEYYTVEKIEEHLNLVKNKGLNFDLIKFKGNHNIHSKTLLNILS